MKTSSDFEKIAVNSRRKRLWKTVLISVLCVIILLGLLVRGLVELTSKHGRRIMESYSTVSQITYPNVDYNSAYYQVHSPFSGQFISHRTKTIDGIEVPYETYQRQYSVFGEGAEDVISNKFADQGYSTYTRVSHQKIPQFFNYKYKIHQGDTFKKTSDIALASQMAGQVLEMAISFDRPYTFKEIQEMIPSNLVTEWYWIGQSNNYNTSELSPACQIGFSVDTDNDKSSSQKRKLWQSFEHSYDLFRSNAKKNLKEKYFQYTTSTGFDFNKELQLYLAKHPIAKKATFQGVVVSGRAKNFEQLLKAKWIYASNIGESVQIQPYHHLTK
ncbi:anti sigma factor C-terminal domain-containing protein [Streptococcus catagoni]|uniref:anti sigma factor C-terminal domain-containing protein n=1 Tax=Streptococcus catagoni TaxID=2654874 RepID=UPI00140D5820|nr:anti sigma factor C-terminal domain-containing protein [Streptococcus catagoni]